MGGKPIPSNINGLYMRCVRRRFDLTQADFARCIGAGKHAVQQWETGVYAIPDCYGKLTVLYNGDPTLLSIVQPDIWPKVQQYLQATEG